MKWCRGWNKLLLAATFTAATFTALGCSSSQLGKLEERIGKLENQRIAETTCSSTAILASDVAVLSSRVEAVVEPGKSSRAYIDENLREYSEQRDETLNAYEKTINNALEEITHEKQNVLDAIAEIQQAERRFNQASRLSETNSARLDNQRDRWGALRRAFRENAELQDRETKRTMSLNAYADSLTEALYRLWGDERVPPACRIDAAKSYSDSIDRIYGIHFQERKDGTEQGELK